MFLGMFFTEEKSKMRLNRQGIPENIGAPVVHSSVEILRQL